MAEVQYDKMIRRVDQEDQSQLAVNVALASFAQLLQAAGRYGDFDILTDKSVQKHKCDIAGQVLLYLQVPAVELHDLLLHLLLVRQQLVRPQEVPVCCIIIVANLRCGLKDKK